MTEASFSLSFVAGLFGSMRASFVLIACIVAACSPAVATRTEVGETFTVGDYGLIVTGAEMTLAENGPAPWDDSKSSDKRDDATRAAGDFGYDVGSALLGGGDNKDLDALLSVYLTFVVDPRGSIHVADNSNVRMSIRDEKGHSYGAASSPRVSYGHSPMRPGQTYHERVVFKVFSNVNRFIVTIGSHEITVEDKR